MHSSLPSTQGRGRSRFSKVLPVPAGEAPITAEKSRTPAALTSRSFRTDLPALPSDAVKAPMAIPRRPVGGGRGGGGDAKNDDPARAAAAVVGVSSVCSDSPGVSRSLSDSSSTKDNHSPNLAGVDSEGPTHKDRKDVDGKPPTAHHKPSSDSISITISSSSSSSGSGFDNAPQPTEIWRRRSAKSDHSIVFSDLILQRSNGSTASQPRRQGQPTTERQQQQPPRSSTARIHLPARPAPPQPEFMGNKISKLRKKGSREDSSNGEGPAPAPAPGPPQTYESVQRLPTPDYLQTDKQHPITPAILSPVSPITPPDDNPPLVPRKSESRSLASHGSSDATIVAPTAPTPENVPPNRHNALAAHSRDGQSIASGAVFVNSPQPQKPPAAARILTTQPSSAKPSPLSLPSPASHAAYFPTVQFPAARGTVVPGPALHLIHFECYQSHKVMRGSNNRLCPVSCMMCQRKDVDKRWRCAWCCLSACGSCVRLLDSVPGKDLRLALEKIRR